MAIYRLDGRSPELPPADRFFVAPDAHVIGNCRLGDEVGIWFGAVLRGDNDPITIGARSNIQEGAMLHTDVGFPLTIGEDCTIGHHAILHGCTIGDGSLIGMGANVLNGARIVGRPSRCHDQTRTATLLAMALNIGLIGKDLIHRPRGLGAA